MPETTSNYSFDLKHGHVLHTRHHMVELDGKVVDETFHRVDVEVGYVDIERTINGYTDIHRIFGKVELKPW